MELVVISAGKISSIFLDDLETPTLTIVVTNHVYFLWFGTINITSDDSSAVLANKNDSIEVINRLGIRFILKRNLSNVLKGTFVRCVDSYLEIFTCRNKHSLVTNNGSTLS